MYKLSRWEKIYYPIYRFWYAYNPRQLYKELKYFYQRGTRGWSDGDWWSTNSYLSKVIPEMLRKQAKDGNSYPFDKTSESWEKELLKAASDIEAYEKFETNVELPENKKDHDKYFEQSKEARRRTREGLKWLMENFMTLWD